MKFWSFVLGLFLVSPSAFAFSKKDCAKTFAELGVWSHGATEASTDGNQYRVTVLNGGMTHVFQDTEFSADSNFIGGILDDGRMALWNVKDRVESFITTPHRTAYRFIFNPRKKQVLVFTTKAGKKWRVQLWDYEKNKPLTKLLKDKSDATFSPDGRWALVRIEDVFHIFNTETGADTGRTIRISDHYFIDRDVFLEVDRDGTARAFKISTGERFAKVKFDWPHQIYPEANVLENRALFTAPEASELWYLRTLRRAHIQLDLTPEGSPLKNQILNSSFSPDGHWVFSDIKGESSSGLLWETSTGRQIATIADREESFGVRPVYSQDGRWVAIQVKHQDQPISALVMNLETKEKFSVSGKPTGFMGNVLLTQHHDGQDSAYSFHNLPEASRASAHLLSAHRLVFAPDGSRFFYVSNGMVTLYEAIPKETQE